MNERLDQLARELLEKTRNNKLDWIPLPGDRGEEEFSVALGEGYQFHILSVHSGENRSITLQLLKDGRALLDSGVNNWPTLADAKVVQDRVNRFRAYSDLFDAVRECVYGKDETLGKVEELLRNIG